MGSNFENIKAKINQFPLSPGVYLMKSQSNKIIYIGKAKSLRNRVRNYFNNLNDQSVKTRFLVQSISDIEYIVTQNEIEALILEAELIKKYKPKYNIRLKDDKSYPYIRISWNDDYPRIYLSRQVKMDGSIYFGPYPKGQVVTKVIEFLNDTFKIRDCSDGFFKSRSRPCLSYQIKKCTAPCVNLVGQEEYRKQILMAKDFLLGSGEKTLKDLEQQMFQLADLEKFEEAAQIREHIKSIKIILSNQKIVTEVNHLDIDFIGYAGNEFGILFETYHIRKGQELGSRSFFFKISFEASEISEQIVTFILQYYENNFIPDQILLPFQIDHELEKLLIKILEDRSNKRVLIRAINNEFEIKTLEKIYELANVHLKSFLLKEDSRESGLLEIKDKFHLPQMPIRIECFDISHLQGGQTVGSQVVFENGEPQIHEYRRYRIRTVQGNNDYQAMKEVLRRRFQNKQLELPHLLLIDGGKGQLNIAVNILKELNLNIPVASVAKSRTEKNFLSSSVVTTQERFYLPGRSNPVTFRSSSPGFRILIQARDEAHRFALKYHRWLREKKDILNS